MVSHLVMLLGGDGHKSVTYIWLMQFKSSFSVNLIICDPVLLNILNLLTYMKEIKCSTSLTFHLFSLTPLINPISTRTLMYDPLYLVFIFSVMLGHFLS